MKKDKKAIITARPAEAIKALNEASVTAEDAARRIARRGVEDAKLARELCLKVSDFT